MCRYRVTKFRCGHKHKMPIPPCSLSPDCTRDQAALLELKTDLSHVRAAIRLYNTNRNSSEYERLHNANHNSREYEPLIALIRNHYASYFGRGSTNGNNEIASLRNIEGYLDEEINAVAQNVMERMTSEDLCADKCWEGLVILGREEQEREGSGAASWR